MTKEKLSAIIIEFLQYKSECEEMGRGYDIDGFAGTVLMQEQNPVQPLVSCVRANKLVKGCIVMMKADSGLIGYGNPQCVSDVCEPLDEISLYGHNRCYKTCDIEKIIEWPFIDQTTEAIGLNDLLGTKHVGMRISARGILGRISNGCDIDKCLRFDCGVMLRHLNQVSERFYAGDVKIIDFFFQLYCLDEHRPERQSSAAP